MSNEWIPINLAVIKPKQCYEVTSKDGSVFVVDGKHICNMAALAVREYNPTPYVPPTPIDPGEGWRLVEKDEPKQTGDEFTDPHRATPPWTPAYNDGEKSERLIYRRRIKPTYRPFANAAEFMPHRHKWTITKGEFKTYNPTPSFSDNHFGGLAWKDAFEMVEFEDGTPFGVEVTK